MSAALAIAWVLSVGADEPPTNDVAAVEQPEPQRHRVLVGIAPGVRLDPVEVATVLRSHLADTGLDVGVETLADATARAPHAWAEQVRSGDRALRAVFTVELAEAGAIRLQLWLAGDAEGWARTLPPGDDDDDDALLESLGVMVRTMATTIEAERPAPAVVVPAPIVPPAPVVVAPVASKRARIGGAIGLGYVGGNVADRSPWMSGVAARGHLVIGSRLTALLGVAFAPTQRAADATRVQRVTIDAGVGATLRPGRRVAPILGAVVVAEAIGWEVREVRRNRGWAARVGAGALVGLDVALVGRLGLLAIARADVWARNATLVLDTPAGRQTLLRGHPVAATAFVGLRLALGEFYHPTGPGRGHPR